MKRREPTKINRRYNLKYTLEPVFGSQWQHTYRLVCRYGGVHLWIREPRCDTDDWYGGIEVHYNEPPSGMADQAPHHNRCWLTDRPCWHDGSSLFVEENILPIFAPGVHPPMFGAVMRWADDTWFAREASE